MSHLNPTEAFAVPGEGHLIDLIHPVTGRSAIRGETLEEIRIRYPGAVKVNIAEWCKARAEEVSTPIEWLVSTGEKYDEMMNVLPPIGLGFGTGAFLVGEPVDHDSPKGLPRYECHHHRSDGAYVVSSRPITVEEFKTLFL